MSVIQNELVDYGTVLLSINMTVIMILLRGNKNYDQMVFELAEEYYNIYIM